MKVIIKPSQLSGEISAAASKSSMQRACVAALLAKGKTIIRNPGHSNDDKAALKILQEMGASIEMNNQELIIDNSGIPFRKIKTPLTIHCGESGLGIRMFTPIIALSDQEIIITGEGSLLNRPMDFFDQVLPQLGVEIKSNQGKLPFTIKGPLQPKDIEIDGSLSSQFLTGLLMAYSAAHANNVSIKVKDLASRPYIDLTLSVMKAFGMTLPENRGYAEFYFQNKLQNSYPTSHEYTVEGDWSGAAFLLVAGAIAGPITVRGLDMSSTQADKAVVEAMMNANAGIAIDAKGIVIHPGTLKGFEFDATDCPDLFPPLVALAAYCKGETAIKGVHRLTHKESNRALALTEEFKKTGVKIDLKDDWMIIYGAEKISGANVHSHHDHRIAMALAVVALKAEGATEIEDAQAINKSYPDFFWHLKKLGADVSLPFKKLIHE